jgi:hypothetical protein
VALSVQWPGYGLESWFDSQRGQEDFCFLLSVKSGPGAHPASYPMFKGKVASAQAIKHIRGVEV